MILNVDEEFREEFWIGRGIYYDRAKLPASVIEARHETERIPKEINDHYFSINLSVAEKSSKKKGASNSGMVDSMEAEE
ncbi:hypothetical protein D9613_000944 [Agrocybe pediades]|uniref:Uncharacterized protein n=1 Tax=Agrocybe pediades TaxID=84607 RepID=A0A8H4QZE1_9AGAR|nr:hypothetical protein D9613_000944 [Agrocybe pediades]